MRGFARLIARLITRLLLLVSGTLAPLSLAPLSLAPLSFVPLFLVPMSAFAASVETQVAMQMGFQKGFIERLSESFGLIKDLVLDVLFAVPLVPQEIARIFLKMLDEIPANASVSNMIVRMLFLVGIQFFIPFVLKGYVASHRAKLTLTLATEDGQAEPAESSPTPKAYFQAAFIDVLDRFVALIFIVILGHLLFEPKHHLGAMGLAIVDAVFRYRLVILARDIVFRPHEPKLALIKLPHLVLRALLVPAEIALAFDLGFILLIQVWLDAGMLITAAQALALIIATLSTVLILFGVSHARKILRMLVATAANTPSDLLSHTPALEALAPHLAKRCNFLISFAGIIAILIWLSWCYGVIALDFPFFYFCINAGTVLVASFVIELLLGKTLALLQMQNPQKQTHAGGGVANAPSVWPSRRTVMAWTEQLKALRSSVHALAVLGVALIISHFLAEDFNTVMGFEHWQTMESAIIRALVVFTIGYIAYLWLRCVMRMHFAIPESAFIPGSEELAPASRLSTVMPLVQGFAGFVILGSGLVYALSELGVNTAPLLAGAGIFGLAISFGSQALVRDIVAGLFFMVDDAFRIGEYIEAGRLKGTVEKISLRSLRLRHQNGQIHTVPFGQLGSVTNHSRDWLTVKFNLRLMRDTDFELVRKTVKRIGEAMLTDEEVGPEFLQPLKLQGIADVQDNATLYRFKFTVRPGKPTIVQRNALKRIVAAFAEKGIEFASNAVIVSHQGRDSQETSEEEQITGAAASVGLNKVSALGEG